MYIYICICLCQSHSHIHIYICIYICTYIYILLSHLLFEGASSTRTMGLEPGNKQISSDKKGKLFLVTISFRNISFSTSRLCTSIDDSDFFNSRIFNLILSIKSSFFNISVDLFSNISFNTEFLFFVFRLFSVSTVNFLSYTS
jgi:hypothetical protein